jgi:uncharacterized membrane protein
MIATTPNLTSKDYASIPAHKTTRITSIDLLRGIVMIIMALDHTRDYFHADAFLFDPTDLSKTNELLFLTRWITHFCAPVFMFLSGTSAFLVGIRKGKKALSQFLLTRGLWLIFLELTVVTFAWYFDPAFTNIGMFVIWALGVSMIALAAFIWLPLPAILAISIAMIAGHNLLDNIKISEGFSSVVWSALHQTNTFNWNGRNIDLYYPVIPWIGVMSLGYCLGTIYNKKSAAIRQRFLFWSGAIAVFLFIVLRYSNVYGDPSPWTQQKSTTFTFLSFLNTTKYPPSLLFLLMTLGPALIFLSFSEKLNGWLSQRIQVIGRVPMFYYLVHLYAIHLLAMFAAHFMGYGWQSMVVKTWVTEDPGLKGYGFSLLATYIIWLALVIGLYFLCKWYDKFKTAHKEKWWLSYL